MLHLGNVRTALFSWLFARHHGGAFVLRIEDTDAERSRSEYEVSLLADLRWFGIDWDEGPDQPGTYGPYRQSDRYEVYREGARLLLGRDAAFYCFCTQEEIEATRRDQMARGALPHYSGKCRALPRTEAETRLRAGEKAALRLRVRPGAVGFDDRVFGRVEIETSQISDPVILRSDGSPTYNFSCVLDDSAMGISHVIRGEGHLSNTHRQVLLYEALELALPEFAHLPTVLGPDGQKLSKRHGADSLSEYRTQGYLPEALLNYLALLGWSPADQGREILSREEIVQAFSLDRVLKSPATFDGTKLDWVNRNHIGRAPADSLVDLSLPLFAAAGLMPSDPSAQVRSWLARVIDAVKNRVDHLDQMPGEALIIYGFGEPPVLDEEARRTLSSPEAKTVAREFTRRIGEHERVTPEAYREIVGQVKSVTGQKGKGLFLPIRAALTGCGSGLDLERLIPLYEEGSRLALPRRVMSCRERLELVLQELN
jgi:glutamyl-tRNA synthetase